VSDAAIVLAVMVFCLMATISFLIGVHARERKEWVSERRFLTDRAIARHVGDVVALDRMDAKRQDGPQPSREHVPTLPEGL